MKLTARTIKHAILGLAIAGTAAVGVGMAAPGAHAAELPAISTTYTDNGLTVNGANFTPGGQVYLKVVDSSGSLLRDPVTTTAEPSTTGSTTCTFFGCFPVFNLNAGTFTYSLAEMFPLNCSPDSNGTVYAYDFGTATWSNGGFVPMCAR